MKQKILFVAPHEDDEIFIGGPMIVNLLRLPEYDVHLLMTTNGDSYSFEGKTRIKELLAATALIGLDSEHVHFAGYGDGWKGKHIYNSEGSEVKTSAGGFTKSYLPSEIKQEWHFERFGEHCDYTRDNFKNDIKDVVAYVEPAVILAVDMDVHSDHRAASLLLDEALGELLKERRDYCPILLKKFAYQGVLMSKQDFFHYPHRRATIEGNYISNPYFAWEDRISYTVPADCNTLLLHSNLMYKMARKHKSQVVWTASPAFINSDIVYWMRNTNNAALQAEISASSGDVRYLNDFKLVDSDNIDVREIDFSNRCWRPSDVDSAPAVTVNLAEPKRVQKLNLYMNCPGGINAGECLVKVTSDAGSTISEHRLDLSSDKDFFIIKDSFDAVDSIAKVELTFCNVSGRLGISEVELLEAETEVPFAGLLYHKDNGGEAEKKSFLLGIEKKVFRVQKILFNRLPNRYKSARKRYDKKKSL